MLSSYFDLRARRQHEERQEERRREDEERRRQDEERRRGDEERRHREMVAMFIAVLSNGRGQSDGQGELIRSLQQTIEELRAENERLRQRHGNGSPDS